jgi:TolB-like protein/Tfp pilus assembly protein PilF
MKKGSFFSELRKRKVLQTAAIYGAVAWGVTEVVVTVVEQLFLPQWVSTLAVIFFVVGFPVAMFLAWTFDFTSEGIRRATISSRRGTASIAASLILLVAGTAGLFFLIRPALEIQQDGRAAAPPMAPNSIAVLPFVNAGANAEDLFIVEGLSDELRDQLGRVSGLRVAARSSSIAASEQKMDAFSASQKLGVANLVEGTVRRQGGVLRVSVQLIEGGSGLALWSETFERGPRELLSVQQAIAEAVVANILHDSDIEIAQPATRDPTANELMLLARHYEQQVRDRQDVDEATLVEAIRLYREATEADPESALAHSRLGGARVYLGDLDAAEAPIFKALSINPNLSEVQNTLGELHWARGLTGEALIAWARAVELDPNNPEALSNYAISLGYKTGVDRVDARVMADLHQRALQLDPLNLERYSTLGTFLALNDETELAHQLIGRIEELFDGVVAYVLIANLFDLLGEVDKSIAWTLRARDLERANPSHVQKLAEYYADINDRETALRLDPNSIGILFKMRRYEEMIDIAEFAMIDQPHDLLLRSLLAMAYNATGQYESAIHVLSTTGLPDSVFKGFRSATEMHGYGALMNALYAIGQTEMARELARFRVYEVESPDGNNWALTISMACDRAILGEDDEARKSMEMALQARNLAWDPVLKDAPCFERFADDPVYQVVVRHFDEHREVLRERLPATLAEFGVEL